MRAEPDGDDLGFMEEEEEMISSPQARRASRRPSSGGSAVDKCCGVLRRLHDAVDGQMRPRLRTAEDRSRMQEFQTLGYVPGYTKIHKTHLDETPTSRDNALQWLLFGVVGISAGLVAFVLRQTIDLMTEWRMGTVAQLIDVGRETSAGGSYFVAWLFLVGTAALLTACSSIMVVYFWKHAAGSGVEEVIAYLNGVDMPRVFNVRTAVVKFLSCVLSVSSGLPAGPEGPMIHLGAICGAGLTQGQSKSFGCTTSLFRKFRNPADHHNFIMAGAAAGISTAFGAPIGGLLFVMEEMATHWRPTLTLMIFFTSMVSFCTVSLFNSAFDAWVPTGTFGWFLNKAAVLFEVKTIIQLNILAIFPSFLIGALAGVLGSAFNFLNVRINLWRRRVIFPTDWKRVLEPVIVAALFATISLLLPVLTSCSEITLPMEEDVRQWKTENATNLATFMCSGENEYSPLGTLMLSNNDGTIRRLFSRNTDPEFGVAPLLIFFVCYFFFACYTAGTSISSGLLVPMIVMGATMGRIVGHLMVQATSGTDIYLQDHQWIDPGVFALLGAAAFVGGVSRLTVSLVVIMLEISAELHFLLPIMIAVMTATWFGDFISPSLYHSYLDMKSVPLMPLQWDAHKIDLNRFCALDAVAGEPLCLPVRVPIRKLCEVLGTASHHCFPVVEVSERKQFLGTISRKDLEVLLRSPDLFEKAATSSNGAASPRNGREDKGAKVLSYVEYMEREEKLFLETSPAASGGYHRLIPAKHFESTLNLDPYINRSPFTVQTNFSLDLTYD
eukprot:gene15592-23797_t